MRILVTGAAGYVGRAAVTALRAAGHDVVALVRSATPPAGVEARWGDVTDAAELRSAVRDVDAVCHLAALTRVREAAERPTAVYRVNLTGTLNLLDAMAAFGVTRLVFTSTGSVYGRPQRQPISEDAPLTPANPYAASKAAAEQLIEAQCATGRLHATVLRIFNAAGDGDTDGSRILPRVVAVADGREPHLTINGDGTAVRDFVHVRDIGAAVALSLDTMGCRAYNLGAVPASVLDIVDAVARVSGRAVPVEHGPAYPGEAAVLRADTARIRAELGWKPECTSLDELAREQWAARP